MRLSPWMFAALLAAPLFAQSFPKTDKDNVSEAIEGAKRGEQPKTDTPKKPEDTPKETPKDAPKLVDGAAALAKFKESRDTFHKQENSETRESSKVLDQLNELVAPYLAAQVALRAGFYKEASKAFKKLVAPTEEGIRSVKGEALDRVNELQGGRHYFYRMVAEVLTHYKYTDNDQEFDRAWTRAERDGQSVIRELQQAIARKALDETRGNITLRRLENWLREEQAYWRDLRAAEKALNEKPGELSSWQEYLNTVSARERDDMTPDYLGAKAALLVLREFWGDDNFVKRGNVDVGLAWIYTGMMQFDRANAALDNAAGLSEEGKKFVGDQRAKIQEIQNALLRELKK